MRLVALIAVAALWAGCESAPPPPPAAIQKTTSSGEVELTLRVARDRISVADNVTIRVEAAYPETYEIDFPDRLGSEIDFRSAVSDTSSPKLGEDGKVHVEQTYLVEPYVPGPIMIPEIEVRYQDKGGEQPGVAKTEAFEINVDPVASAEEQTAELRDIRDPLAMPFPLGWAIAGGLLALALLGGLWLWWRSQRKPAPVPVEPPRPIDEIALSELDALVAEGLAEQGRIKELYGRVSDILRRYIEARFGLRAPEQTTEEFLSELRRTLGFDPAHRALLRQFLEHTDMVKFAESRPIPPQIDATLAACRRFITETKPKPETVPEGPVVPRA